MPLLGKWFWPLIFYALGGVVALVAAYRILSSEKKYPGAQSLASALISGSAWVLSIAGGLVSPTPEAKLIWLLIRYLSISLLSTAFYITMNQYLNGRQWLTWRIAIFLSVVPHLISILFLTNGKHNLIHTQIILEPYGPYQTLVTKYGVGMWIFLAYSIGLVLVGSIYIVSMLLRTRRTSSIRGILILVGIIVPIIIILIQIRKTNPFGYFSPVPLAIILSAIVSGYLLENARRQQLVRVSRSRLFENIEDMVIVLDNEKRRIIDMNSSAEKYVGKPLIELIGQDITGAWPDIHAKIFENMQGSEFEDRIVLERHGAETTCEFKFIELLNWQNLPINYMLVIRDINTHATLEGQISAALREKETLLREIHHRAKNNLQVISSMFNLQSAMIRDFDLRSAFQECQDRIEVIALVHEQLYQTEGLQHINFAGYIETMLNRLWINSEEFLKDVNVDTRLDDIHLSIDLATPCALIAYELLTNAQKHAFSGRRTGRVSVILQRQENSQCLLAIRDDGVGIPEYINLQGGGNLGLKLVRALVSQIAGTLMIQRQAGTEIEIRFPLIEASK